MSDYRIELSESLGDSMTIAELVTIGTELLLGEIQDTNSKYIARSLRDIGVDIYRLTTIGDNPNRITHSLQAALMRSDVVICTGGLGPTVDDPTRKAVADVFNVPLVYREELWEDIVARYKTFNRVPTENNKRQAFIPANGIAIRNPVGTAPAFYVELGIKTIIALPGVPREMQFLMENFVIDYLKERYDLHEQIIKAWVIHTISKGESAIDEIIGHMETYSNPTVGLVAYPGRTDIRVTAKAASSAEAKAMMRPVIDDIHELLGEYIYGENETTLEIAIAEKLIKHNLRLAVIESGTKGLFSSKLKIHAGEDHFYGENLDVFISEETLKQLMTEIAERKNADIVLGIRFSEKDDTQNLYQALLAQDFFWDDDRSYAGPKGDGLLWAFSASLDSVRRKIKDYC